MIFSTYSGRKKNHRISADSQILLKVKKNKKKKSFQRTARLTDTCAHDENVHGVS